MAAPAHHRALLARAPYDLRAGPNGAGPGRTGPGRAGSGPGGPDLAEDLAGAEADEDGAGGGDAGGGAADEVEEVAVHVAARAAALAVKCYSCCYRCYYWQQPAAPTRWKRLRSTLLRARCSAGCKASVNHHVLPSSSSYSYCTCYYRCHYCLQPAPPTGWKGLRSALLLLRAGEGGGRRVDAYCSHCYSYFSRPHRCYYCHHHHYIDHQPDGRETLIMIIIATTPSPQSPPSSFSSSPPPRSTSS